MIKYLSLFLLFFTLSYSKDYPSLYSKMGNPLYSSIEHISKLSNIKEIEDASAKYITQAKNTLEYGNKIDEHYSRSNSKEYLLKLRKLQKEYSYILHLIHKNINSSIDKKDYDLFLKLTSYEFDGLLKSSSLLDKSIKFYKKKSTKKKSEILEKKIAFKTTLANTTQEFYNVSHKSTFNSSKQQPSPSKKELVNLEAKQTGNTITINIENRNPYSVTVNLKPVYKNISYDKNTPSVVVLKANTKKEYTKLHIKKGGSSYSYSYTWIIGSVYAIHDDSYIYGLPYQRGDSYVVTQGYNGEFTHKGHSQYAIDFGMEVGTKLYAAREGVVVKIKSDSNKRGDTKEFAKYGNHIIVEHSDSTFSTYYHLKKNGVGVRVGQRVKRGQLIGYSGNTGFSRGPHLHFAVFKAVSAKSTKSLPIRFASIRGIINKPKVGTFYMAK